MDSKLHVFLCHASEDKPAALALYDWLESIGADPWLDRKKLLPGQNWELEIRRAVRRSDVVLVLSSRQSMTKTGYVQKEIKLALDEADKQPEGAIYVIPVRLEACDMPDRLSHLQWVDLFEPEGHQNLFAALQLRATELGRTPLTGSPPPPPDGISHGNLADHLTIGLDRGGLHPHKAGPGQWWVRLKIESRRSLKNCQGQLYDVLRLQGLDDPDGTPLPESEASILSWSGGRFQLIDIEPNDVPEYLDLAWHARGDPPMPDDELRVASSKDPGERDTSSEHWGHRQDFIPLKPGLYRLIVRLVADGYAPLEQWYCLHWPGPGREDEIHLLEEGAKQIDQPGQPAQQSSATALPVISGQTSIKLAKILRDRFSLDGLEDFSFHLGIEFDDLPSQTKAGKARELAKYLVRHDRIADVIVLGKSLRPDIAWDELLANG